MRFTYYSHGSAVLARGTALVLLAGLVAGCSGDAMRFADLGLTTSATDNQRSIIGQAPQTYPDQYGATNNLASAAVATPTNLTTSSVSRTALPAVQAAGAQVDRGMQTASTAAAGIGASAAAAGAGWSGTGGTKVTLLQGETLFSLSRRFGVPVGEILKANAIADANSVQAGSQIVIPTYVYSRTTPVSAPDNDPRVAQANSAASQTPQSAPPVREVAMAPSGSAAVAAGSGTSASGTYKVAAGDTLHRIAAQHGVTTSAIQKANGLDGGLIRIGQVLTIPGKTGSTTQIAATPPVQQAVAQPATVRTVKAEPAVVRKAEENLPQYTPPTKRADEVIQNARVEAPDATGAGKMRWPARGRVVAEFGSSLGGRKNDGIDISVPEGTSVRAAENGVVIYAGDSLKDFGNTILLRHEDGLVTVYGHASKLKVARGAVVKRGDEIALSGLTGSTDVPKLHFEVRKDSVPVNPMGYLQ